MQRPNLVRALAREILILALIVTALLVAMVLQKPGAPSTDAHVGARP